MTISNLCLWNGKIWMLDSIDVLRKEGRLHDVERTGGYQTVPLAEVEEWNGPLRSALDVDPVGTHTLKTTDC